MSRKGLLARAFVAYCRAGEHPGKVRVIRWLGTTWLRNDDVRCVVDQDVALDLHPRDWIEYCLLKTGKYEPMTLRFLRRNLAAGDDAVLAGVNFGLHVVVAARAIGSSGRVFGVEPQPRALARARCNLEINGLERQVRLVSAALGSSRCSMAMAWAPVDNPGVASLFDESRSPFQVQVVPWQDLCRDLAVSRPRLTLLDVQGFEPEVLRGMADGPRPEILVVEVDRPFLARAGTVPDAVLGLMLDLGYELFDLQGERLAVFPDNLPEGNVVAVLPDARSVNW